MFTGVSQHKYLPTSCCFSYHFYVKYHSSLLFLGGGGWLEYWKKDSVTMEMIIYPAEGRRIFFFFFNKEESRFSFGNVGLVGKVDAASF